MKNKKRNEKVEKGFPKDPDNITGKELKEHFDLNKDGNVTLEEYSEHINYHCENPDVLEGELEQADYERGFKYAKGGRIEDLKQEILDYDRNVFGGRKGLGNKQNYFPTDMQKNGPQRYGEIIRFFKDKGYTQGELHQALQEIDYYTYMEKGGALEKEFKFDKNFVIYVPSTSDVGNKISKKELDKRVDEVEKYVANEFGGYTETDTDGGYKSTSGEIVEEDIVKVSVFANNKVWKDNEQKVVSKVKKWATEWGQEAIGFEYEGDLYYIDDEGKFAKGGKLKEKYVIVYTNDSIDPIVYGPYSSVKKAELDIKKMKENSEYDYSEQYHIRTLDKFEEPRSRNWYKKGGDILNNKDFLGWEDHKNLNQLMKGKKIKNVVFDGSSFAIILDGGMYVAFDTWRASYGNSSRLKKGEEFEKGGTTGSYSVVIENKKDKKRGFGNTELIYNISKKEADFIADKLNDMTPKSARSEYSLPFEKGGLTPKKAKQMLKDGKAQGHPLTDKQKRYFKAISRNKKYKSGGYTKTGERFVKVAKNTKNKKELNGLFIYNPYYNRWGWINDKNLEDGKLPYRVKISYSKTKPLGEGRLENINDLIIVKENVYKNGGEITYNEEGIMERASRKMNEGRVGELNRRSVRENISALRENPKEFWKEQMEGFKDNRQTMYEAAGDTKKEVNKYISDDEIKTASKMLLKKEKGGSVFPISSKITNDNDFHIEYLKKELIKTQKEINEKVKIGDESSLNDARKRYIAIEKLIEKKRIS